MTFSIAFLPNVGPLEVAIVLIILLVIFGPKRIPAAFRAIGDAFKGFRDTVGGEDEEVKDPAALPEPSPDVSKAAGPGDKASGEGEKTKANTDA